MKIEIPKRTEALNSNYVKLFIELPSLYKHYMAFIYINHVKASKTPEVEL